MGSMTITYGAASMSAAFVPAAAAAHAHTATTHLVDRKADDRFRPRGRRL